MEASHCIIPTPSCAIKAEVAGTHMHATQPGRRNEQMDKPHVIHNSKVVSEGTELNMDKPRAVGRVYWVRRLLAGSPSACLGILDKDAEGDLEAIGRNARNAACIGPGELPTSDCY